MYNTDWKINTIEPNEHVLTPGEHSIAYTISIPITTAVKTTQIFYNCEEHEASYHILAASWSSGSVPGLGIRILVKSRIEYPAGVTARCAPEQGSSRCIASLDPGGNGYLWG